MIFSPKKKFEKKFFENFLKKCAGARAGPKNGVRVRAPHITIFVQCACGCGPKSPHTKGLEMSYSKIFFQ